MAIYDINTSKQDYLTQFYQTLLLLLNSSGTGAGDISTPRLSLIAMTKVKIDELMAQSEGVEFNLDNADNANIIDLYINALLDESAKHILQTAPIHAIIPTDGGTIAPQFTPGSEDGYIWLPDDYLRLVSFKIAGWKRDASNPITTRDPLYALQGTVLKGGKAKPVIVLNSRIKTNAPQAQIDSVKVVGSSGTAQISGPGGLSKELVFNTSEIQTASDFVTANSAAYTGKGITLSRTNNTLYFTANVAGVPFDHPIIITTDGDLTGEVSRDQANIPAREGKKILEYYSDPTKVHTLEKFLYIANVGAEYIQADLHDALTWLCASKLLQIWGQFSGNESYSAKAMSQVELCYQNLL